MESGKPSMHHMMETELLRMPRMRLNTTLLYLYGWVPLASVAILAVPALLAGIFHDIRWLIIFLMVCFIFSPMLMAFLYFYHGLRPSTSSNVALHRLSFTPDGITVTVYAEKKEKEQEKEKEKVVALHSARYPYTAIKQIETGPDAVILHLSPPFNGFLWLPYNAFANKDDFSEALGLMRSAKTNANLSAGSSDSAGSP